MSFGLSKNELDLVVKILKKYPKIRSAKIFGSRSNGNFNQSSDIDLALFGDLDLDLMASLKQDFIESDLIYKVDIINYQKANEALKLNIDKSPHLLF